MAERRTFYSTRPGLVIQFQKGQVLNVDGRATRVGQREIEFVPQADGYGLCITDDQEKIDYLEERTRTIGDILLPPEYHSRVTPDAIKLEQERMESARLLRENNRLLEELARQKQQRTGGASSNPPR